MQGHTEMSYRGVPTLDEALAAHLLPKSSGWSADRKLIPLTQRRERDIFTNALTNTWPITFLPKVEPCMHWSDLRNLSPSVIKRQWQVVSFFKGKAHCLTVNAAARRLLSSNLSHCPSLRRMSFFSHRREKEI